MAAEVSKPDFSFQWASGGSIVAPSDVKIQTGWTAEVPPFQWENFSQNRQDNAILHLFQKGISEWDAASNYYFTASGVRSYVQGSDGYIYVAVSDSLNQNPVTDTTNTYWKLAFSAKPFLDVISASGNFTVPSNVYFLDVEVSAGGGGGGGVGLINTTAGGGGGGGYGRKIIAVTPGQVIACTIGAAGAAGGVGGSGGTGGASSFGAFISTAGGVGGAPNPVGAGGAGGTSTGGDINITGGGGGSGVGTLNGGSGGGSGRGFGGNGAAGLGDSGRGVGGGGAGRGGSTTGAGSAGSAGQIIVHYWSIV